MADVHTDLAMDTPGITGGGVEVGYGSSTLSSLIQRWYSIGHSWRLPCLLLSPCWWRSIFFTHIMHWYQRLWVLPMPSASLDLYLTFLWQLPAITSVRSQPRRLLLPLQKRSMHNHQVKIFKHLHMIQQSHSWAYIYSKLQFKKINAPLCS